MKRRDYAISLGLAKPGRGRMSRAAHEAIAKAEAEGKTFSDSPVKSDSPKSNSDSADKPDSVKSNSEPKDFFGPTPNPIYNGGWYVVENGKRVDVSGKEVCRNCMCSLDYHRCDSPILPAWNGEMVEVIR